MSSIPTSLQNLIDEFAKLPGVGKKSAGRMAIYVLKNSSDKARQLADALVALKEKVVICRTCYNIAEGEQCPICSDPKRDRVTICVVEQASDILPVEKSGAYFGLYHVLGGVLSPLDHQNEEQLHIGSLIKRIERDGTKEVIVATNPTTEGETTAMLLAQRLQHLDVKVTRIARGLPVGSELEFADEATLTRALQGRGEL
ncbi:recombination protein RecR [candidate division LCP-89 bacterium B3_LCP]|uniref:Recombination protein RecR n=1 Tax=candidate division LCP-89 bacterium B3_LCP TaxID=2012998 RepID=A0A532V5F3_UNCL8|nr:MAG: recombination protein RecR [candidate division LCP-89 bacterium B3_LCP]